MKKGSLMTSGLRKYNTEINFASTKKETIVELISALFILLFLYTALSKSIKIESTENVLRKIPSFENYAVYTAWGVVILEYLSSLLLFLPKTRKVGLYFSFILMFGFTCYILYMKLFVPNLPCSCGGVISKMTWNQHLVFNISFCILSLIGIVLMRKHTTSEAEEDSMPAIFT